MDNLSNISVIKDILTRHGFSFSKTLGQNFLVNPTVCPKMAEQGNAKPGFGVIEIGTGIGVLTAELAKRADKVVCIEIDSRLLPVLEETLSEYHNIKVINEDVLKVDLQKLIEDEFEGLDVAICANLPYYITSPIIMSILEAKLRIKSVTVMVQKEAAQRICAASASRESGAISVAVRYYSEPKLLFHVSRGSFMPSPDVDSAVIRLDIRETPPVNVNDEAMLFALIKAAFSMRRKTVVNAVSASFNYNGMRLSKPQVIEILRSCNLSETIRAEAMTLQDFANIANEIDHIK